MRDLLRITDVHLARAARPDTRTGLLGWISFTLDGRLRVDGLTLRRTHDGRPVLSYPERTDQWGCGHPYLAPLDDETRRHIEREVVRALKAQGSAA